MGRGAQRDANRGQVLARGIEEPRHPEIGHEGTATPEHPLRRRDVVVQNTVGVGTGQGVNPTLRENRALREDRVLRENGRGGSTGEGPNPPPTSAASGGWEVVIDRVPVGTPASGATSISGSDRFGQGVATMMYDVRLDFSGGELQAAFAPLPPAQDPNVGAACFQLSERGFDARRFPPPTGGGRDPYASRRSIVSPAVEGEGGQDVRVDDRPFGHGPRPGTEMQAPRSRAHTQVASEGVGKVRWSAESALFPPIVLQPGVARLDAEPIRWMRSRFAGLEGAFRPMVHQHRDLGTHRRAGLARRRQVSPPGRNMTGSPPLRRRRHLPALCGGGHPTGTGGATARGIFLPNGVVNIPPGCAPLPP